jgi:hypothetical protein
VTVGKCVAVPVLRGRAQPLQRFDVARPQQQALHRYRLKKLLVEAELDKAMLKELAEGNF